MTKVIWKFHLPVEDEFNIKMPIGAEILKIHDQGGVGYMWVLLDESRVKVVRRFKTVGTGHEMKMDLAYIGTYFDKQFVWHIFEK